MSPEYHRPLGSMWLVRPVDLPVLEGIMIHVDLDKPGVVMPSYFSAFCYVFL
jgi:hypothetical protein